MTPNEKLLVAALRGGKYTQTYSRLRDGTGFCVTGVACDVADADGWSRSENGWEWYGYMTAVPPGSSLLARFGWATTCLAVSDREGGYVHLEVLNDVDRLPFTQFADLIEAGLVPQSDSSQNKWLPVKYDSAGREAKE